MTSSNLSTLNHQGSTIEDFAYASRKIHSKFSQNIEFLSKNYFSIARSSSNFTTMGSKHLNEREARRWLLNLKFSYENTIGKPNRNALIQELKRSASMTFEGSTSSCGEVIRHELSEWSSRVTSASNPAFEDTPIWKHYENLDLDSSFYYFLITTFRDTAYQASLNLYISDPEHNSLPISMPLLKLNHIKTSIALIGLINDENAPCRPRQFALAILTVQSEPNFYTVGRPMFDVQVLERKAWPKADDLERFCWNIGKSRLAELLPILDYEEPSFDNPGLGANRLFDAALLRNTSPYRLYSSDQTAEDGYSLVCESETEFVTLDEAAVYIDQSCFYKVSPGANSKDIRRIDNTLELFSRACDHSSKTGRFKPQSNVIEVDFGRSLSDFSSRNQQVDSDE